MPSIFDPQSYNSVFDVELEKMIDRLRDNEARQQAAEMRGFEWGQYIARSLVRAGFRGDDVQEHCHAIVVKLIVSPGRLFRGWEPGRHGPLDRRFQAAVWNAIRNITEKQRNYRRRMTPADPTIMAERLPGRRPYSGVLDDFRRLVAERLGPLAAAILDQRLADEDTKDLVGRADLGSPGKYIIKREVQAIKTLARQFAAESGDRAFLLRVIHALEAEAETVNKRQTAMAARRAAAVV